MFTNAARKVSTGHSAASFPRFNFDQRRLHGLADLAAVNARRAVAVRRGLPLGDLGARPAAGSASVFRPKIVRLRGLGDITCRIDPATGGRVCSNDPSPINAAAFPDGTLVKGAGPSVSQVIGGQRRWIPDPATFAAMGFNWGQVQTIPDAQYNAIPQGPAFSSVAPVPAPAPAPSLAPMPAALDNAALPAATAPATIQPATPSSALPTNYVSSAPASFSAGGIPSWVKWGGIGLAGLVALKMFGVIGKK